MENVGLLTAPIELAGDWGRMIPGRRHARGGTDAAGLRRWRSACFR